MVEAEICVESGQKQSDTFIHQGAEVLTSSVATTFGLQDQIPPSETEDTNNNSSNAMTFDQRNTSFLDPLQFEIQDIHLPAAPQRRSTPLCRQFWQAGNYENFLSESNVSSTNNYLHVHPKFLHSNATSHKWPFGAVAELLDNAIDEIQNGATFVMVDKISDSRDGSPALLIQDDGGGMDPEAIWRCVSFGFSHKTSEKTIGQYGNGFKTSTMRLGSDAIVFTRQMNSGKLTQSIGLLSYTYLCRKGMNRIVIPMIHYEYNMSNATWEPVYRDDRESFHPNISIILQWSPYSTEAELLKQLDDIGSHGTKVIIYNLWYAEERALELDFSTDPEDIRLQGPITHHKNSKSLTTEEHIATQYHYSLRVYMSILYLQLPQNFSMFLRGKVVEHHRIACDLKFPEFIVYKPHTRKLKEEKDNIITMIGFLKEAPNVDINGFNVYHKNRLILPFWKVVSGNRSRGIVGVLEANFAVPIHNKQDFERTPLFERLEKRLKIMIWEYWDCHCGLIGYQLSRKPPRSSLFSPSRFMFEPVNLDRSSMTDPAVLADPVTSSLVEGQQLDPTRTEDSIMSGLTRRRHIRLVTSGANEQTIKEFVMMMQENEKLEEKCMEYMKTENELVQKVSLLKEELEEERNKYGRMLSELQELGFVAIL